LRRLLTLLCGLSVAVIALELSYETGHEKVGGQNAVEAAYVAPAPSKGVGPAADAVDQWVAVALARPLFAADRKPASSSSGDGGLPRLTGVIDSPSDAVAIFQAAGNERPVLARRGDAVAGWQVTTIAGDAVGLQRADGRLIIKPEFDNSKAGGLTKVVKQPQSRWEAAPTTGLLRARWSNPQLQP
jgi:hypothetical protein